MLKLTKKIFFIFYLIYLDQIFSSTNINSSEDPFTVVLMVKNEEHVINKTLEPYVKEGIKSYLVFDTGSTDKTISTVQDYFKSNNVKNWHVLQEPFVDFATSRNRALDLAEEKFPEAKFFLMPDAEWYLHNVKGLIDFCNRNLEDSAKCYLLRIVNGGIDFTTTRLIKAGTKARFAGVVHECVVTDNYKKVSSDIYFELGVTRSGYEKSKQRWERDLKLLQEAYDKNPNDSRNTFYLAQTYECLGMYIDAYKYYEIRSHLAGWDEENYETFYRLGRLADLLSKTDKSYTWHMAQDYYFMAHKLRPHRAEPLVKLAEHYWPDGTAPENMALCYLFAKRAYELPYPERDLLFIDPEIYNFKRYELLSKSAWHVGDLTLGEVATKRALKNKEMPHLYRNLALYLEAKTK